MKAIDLIKEIAEHDNNNVYIKYQGKYYTIKRVTEEISELTPNTFMTMIEIEGEGI